MDLPFDVKKEQEKLAELREREEEDVARILSEKYGMTYVDLTLHDVQGDALRLIPEVKAKEAEVITFEKVAKVLSVGIHNPANPSLSKVLGDLESRDYTLKKFLISKKSFEKALARYRDLSLTSEVEAGKVTVSNEILQTLGKEGSSRASLKNALDSAIELKPLDRVTRLFDLIVAGAFALNSSDIHLEPEEHAARLRLRIDGLLSDIYSFDPSIYHQLNSRIKLLSGVKLNVLKQAQDGRFSVVKGDTQIEIRASFIPGNFGEAIVLRILDPETTQKSFRDLGINDKLLKRLKTEIHRPNGMLLTTGPTGSGKTTTLYSFLREIYTPEIKIITIEDPVEYHLEGIVQTQVSGKQYSFAEGLKSIVRQDPDVIMVGEIRDSATADIAIQAALTGHFVFSTLHTNDAAGTFPRLVDLGADPKSFGSAVTVSMAQRLVRRLDPMKKKERALTSEEKETVAKVFASLADKSLIPEKIETVWDPITEGDGVTGYKGRVGLYEAIFMDDELAQFLRDNPPEHEIAKLAIKQGYPTMAQDGILKALVGLTSLSEVLATVDFPQ